MPRSKTTFVSIAVAMLAVLGCGSTNHPTTTGIDGLHKLPPGVAPNVPLPPARSATYTVNLAGFSAGSPNGSALAVVTLNPSTEQICWSFSQLKNVTAPTEARLFQNFPGASGRGGYPLGKSYKPSGCIHKPKEILSVIESRAETFYLNIHDRQFPGGAVRGPL